MAKAFDTVWIDGLLYKLTLRNFPSYIVNTISSYLRGRTFEASFQTATSSLRGMQARVAQGGFISPVLYCLYVNDMPLPSHHVALVLYADDTAIIAKSRKPSLRVSYLESYPNELQRWLSELRMANNVTKSSPIIFALAGQSFIQPRPETLTGESIQWVESTLCLGVNLDKRLNWSTHIDQIRKKTAQRMGMFGSLLHRKNDLSVRNVVLLHKQLTLPMLDYACHAWRSAARILVRTQAS